MKKSIVLILIVCGLTSKLFAQDRTKVGTLLFGNKDAPSPLMLSVDAYPFLFLANGGGGSIGLEFNHWQVGLIGFSVVPPDFIKNTFFQNAEGVNIRRNSAAELYARYYLRPDRKGIYISVLGGPEWFVMEDNDTKVTESLVKSYVVPNLGFRVFPFKEYFYFDASFGYSFNLSGTEERILGAARYSASKGGMIYFFQLGVRFRL
ncbi:hypothetical protein [Aquiflexum lacus]|uniref:hypothetical protein n=1 Tax=Aquiflexum lacus TaxID=2483805 RepID=UPI001895846E|nr:hypothetical protein [Aquiflexum lacus]